MAQAFGRDRYRFERRTLDINSDPLGDWGAGQIVRSADTLYLRGGESVQQQRLAGQQPVVITVRDCRQTRTIDEAWRAVDVRNGKRFDIRSAAPAKDRAFIDILAVEVKGDDD